MPTRDFSLLLLIFGCADPSNSDGPAHDSSDGTETETETETTDNDWDTTETGWGDQTGWIEPVFDGCGDGDSDSGEACDDGNASPSDGCLPNCMIRECGNNIIEPPEQCDSSDGCLDNCRMAPWVSVDAGRVHACAIDAVGEIACWGAGDFYFPNDSWGDGQVDIDPGPWHAMTAGPFITCALDDDDLTHCWGDDEEGQMEIPDTPFTALASTFWSVCGLDYQGKAHCWGEPESPTGELDPPDVAFVEITAGAWHYCGRTAAGEAICWGGAGIVDALDLGEGPWKAVVAGYTSTCGLRELDGSVACVGALADMTAPEGSFDTLAVSASDACVADSTGTTHCWGLLAWGENPADVSFSVLSGGERFFCGLTTTGDTECWGKSDSGQTWAP